MSEHKSPTAAESWKQFCGQLEDAGQRILAEPASEREQAEGLRYLTRLLRIGLEMHLEHSDPLFPVFYQASHTTGKIGSDNPDNYYQNATISSEYSYRISGQRGSVPILSFGTKANRYAVDGTMASTGELDSLDMQFNKDGSFEIIASKEKHDGNWVPLADDSSMLIVRQTFIDRSKETRADVTIECLEAPAHPEAPELDTTNAALSRTAAFVGGTANTFLDWAHLFKKEQLNQLATKDQNMFFRAGGDPTIFYLHGWWELKENQALTIHSTIPDCEGWNFQVNNLWMESLDYRYHTIHTNNGLAELNDDGTVTVVVAAENKGYKNWIDTSGLTRGTMLWRWTNAKDHPLPETGVIDV